MCTCAGTYQTKHSPISITAASVVRSLAYALALHLLVRSPFVRNVRMPCRQCILGFNATPSNVSCFCCGCRFTSVSLADSRPSNRAPVTEWLSARPPPSVRSHSCRPAGGMYCQQESNDCFLYRYTVIPSVWFGLTCVGQKFCSDFSRSFPLVWAANLARPQAPTK
jgi:hypothetical protein